MKITNISVGKIIGLGDVTVMPGETKKIPEDYESNPTLKYYEEAGLVLVIGDAVSVEPGTVKPKRTTRTRKAKEVDEDAEKLRLARLESLKGISEESLGRLAQELGINPADCKDSDDVLTKVKAALEKK